jgi:acyl carrier protein
MADALVRREGDMHVRDRVRRFICESFLVDDFADDESFLGAGIVDSLGMMQLVAFLESEFGIAIDDSELVPENLESVVSAAAFVERKRAALAA